MTTKNKQDTDAPCPRCRHMYKANHFYHAGLGHTVCRGLYSPKSKSKSIQHNTDINKLFCPCTYNFGGLQTWCVNRKKYAAQCRCKRRRRYDLFEVQRKRRGRRSINI